jgi:hypothetical protein
LPEDLEILEEITKTFPIRFVRVTKPKWLGGICNKCNSTLGETIWMAHGTPYLKWEGDPSYSLFILCDKCGLIEKVK